MVKKYGNIIWNRIIDSFCCRLMLDKISAETKIDNKEEDKPITVQNLTQDIKDEWMFGYTSRKEEGE